MLYPKLKANRIIHTFLRLSPFTLTPRATAIFSMVSERALPYFAIAQHDTLRVKTKKEQKNFCSFHSIVRVIGLEPTRRKTPDPKSGASTNFATRATVLIFRLRR